MADKKASPETSERRRNYGCSRFASYHFFICAVVLLFAIQRIIIDCLTLRGLIFSTLARTGLEPAVVETRAVDLLLAAIIDFAACQGSVSSFPDLGQAHPFVYARPNGYLAVSLQLPP